VHGFNAHCKAKSVSIWSNAGLGWTPLESASAALIVVASGLVKQGFKHERGRKFPFLLSGFRVDLSLGLQPTVRTEGIVRVGTGLLAVLWLGAEDCTARKQTHFFALPCRCSDSYNYVPTYLNLLVEVATMISCVKPLSLQHHRRVSKHTCLGQALRRCCRSPVSMK
jgi:hypothetical protein